MVPTLVPIAIEIRQEIRNIPGIAMPPGMILSIRLAVLDAPPAVLASPLNAPAIKKMNSMMTILSSPMPFAQTEIFSLKLSERFWKKATISEIPNATTTDMT